MPTSLSSSSKLLVKMMAEGLTPKELETLGIDPGLIKVAIQDCAQQMLQHSRTETTPSSSALGLQPSLSSLEKAKTEDTPALTQSNLEARDQISQTEQNLCPVAPPQADTLPIPNETLGPPGKENTLISSPQPEALLPLSSLPQKMPSSKILACATTPASAPKPSPSRISPNSLPKSSMASEADFSESEDEFETFHSMALIPSQPICALKASTIPTSLQNPAAPYVFLKRLTTPMDKRIKMLNAVRIGNTGEFIYLAEYAEVDPYFIYLKSRSETPLTLAVSLERTEITKWILQNSPSSVAHTVQGRNILMYAAEKGLDQMFILIDKYAPQLIHQTRINAQNKTKTVFDSALQGRSRQIITYLLNKGYVQKDTLISKIQELKNIEKKLIFTENSPKPISLNTPNFKQTPLASYKNLGSPNLLEAELSPHRRPKGSVFDFKTTKG